MERDRLTHFAATPFTDRRTYCGKSTHEVHAVSNTPRFVDCPECIRIRAAFDKARDERGRAVL